MSNDLDNFDRASYFVEKGYIVDVEKLELEKKLEIINRKDKKGGAPTPPSSKHNNYRE